MSAAEHDRVGATLDERPRIARDELARRGARKLAGLDLLDQARARLRDDLHLARVLLEQRSEARAFERADRREHADDAAARRADGGLHGRLHRDDRELETLAQRRGRRGRRRVARDHDGCRALAREELREHERAFANVVLRLVAKGTWPESAT